MDGRHVPLWESSIPVGERFCLWKSSIPLGERHAPLGWLCPLEELYPYGRALFPEKKNENETPEYEMDFF